MNAVADNAAEELRKQLEIPLAGHVAFMQKRPGIFQLHLPIFHEDGDMVEVFIQRLPDGSGWRISDFGMSLMRLSYDYEIDTPKKEEILSKLLAENSLLEDDGSIYIDAPLHGFYPYVLQFAYGIAKICSMRYFKREVIESLFYENLGNYIETSLQTFKPRRQVRPIPEREEVVVDWALQPNGTPVYLLGVRDNAKARLATITCLEMQKYRLDFHSIVVHDNTDKLGKRDLKLLTNACDKQYTSLDDFFENGRYYLERLAHK